ncbi:MAG: SMP-30/gluconolactonase/LRE family protein [Bacteroidales bacterium]|nr:SMP-30/gluconolactonase/LRE family protein [Bacteroidales bacterium]
MKISKYLLIGCLLSAFIGLKPLFSQQQKTFVEFNSDQFQIVQGEVIEHLDRTTFKGIGFLPGLKFKNGVIEVDMAVTGQRSYPGVNFRIQSQKEYEHFYIRPHRSGLYPDALQYTPCTNGIDSWQLFNGEGYTASVTIPKNEWFHVKIEIKDSRARVFINEAQQPSLEIVDLYHGESEGSISLNCPINNSAFFSNLSYYETDELIFEELPVKDHRIGLITDWEISQPFGILDVELDKTPAQQNLNDISWQSVTADKNGLVNIANTYGRISRASDIVYARTIINAEKDTLVEMKFGYSDVIMIFFNDQIVFYGNSGYTQRDPSFLGIIGLNDAVYLPLKKGKNELLIGVVESFGGWGFIFQDGNAVFMENGITKLWETEKVFNISESVLWDPKREVLYVSNFDQLNMGNPNIYQSISKVSPEGEIIKLNWVDSLNNPLGMTIYNDKLYIAERGQVAEIDLDRGEVIRRISVPGSFFLNDIAIDKKGNIYISDSRKNVIWKLSDGVAEEWLTGPDVLDPNALYMLDGKLLFGNSGDSWLKAVDLTNKNISKIARFPQGFIDGIRVDNNGNLLVSLWKGKIYKVSEDGLVSLILHTENRGHYSADFEYIPEKGLLIVPTFYNNTVQAFRY